MARPRLFAAFRVGCLGLGMCIGLVAAQRGYAQHPAPPAIPEADTNGRDTWTLHVRSRLVLVDASVELRRTGQRIPDLTAGDFTLTEDGAPQTITGVSEDRLPLSLVLLLDLTDSVHPVLVHLADGANAVLHHLRPEDEVAVMTFSSQTKLVQGFTRDRMSAVEGLDSAAASYDRNEPTFLFEDLGEAVAQSARSRVPDSRRVEIWLTDGSANDQETQRGLAHHAPATLYTETQATDALLRSGVVISALIERSLASGRQTGHFGDLERLAGITGGPVVHATEGDVADRLGALLDTLRQRYTLSYRPEAVKPDGAVCHLHLALSPAFFAAHPELRPKDIAIRSRSSYVREAGRHGRESAGWEELHPIPSIAAPGNAIP